MRQKIYLILLALCAMVLVPERAHANDFLEKEKHYSAYTAGANKIHFKIPLFSESESGYSRFIRHYPLPRYAHSTRASPRCRARLSSSRCG